MVYEPARGQRGRRRLLRRLRERPAPGRLRLPARWRFAIGDVCGTGPEAAAVTGLARHALRILAAEDMSVPDVLTRLNRLILGEGERGRCSPCCTARSPPAAATASGSG